MTLGDTLLAEFLTSGISVGILGAYLSSDEKWLIVGCANFVTLPLDVLKVRLQTQAASFSSRAAAPGLFATTVNIVRQEGFFALYSGLTPAISRGLFYGGARLGTYGPIKTALGGDKTNNSVLRNILAGCLSGSFAAAATNPIDLIKTRLQARDSPFKNGAAVMRHVVKEQGVSGLWTGTTPSVIRAAALTATQCASYDLAKQWWMRQTGMSDNVGTHFGASMLTGLATTTITAPVDLVKTNMFVGGKRYTSVLHCASTIVKEDGPMGLLKGWTAQYIRLGPQTMVIFVVMEQLRRASGLSSL